MTQVFHASAQLRAREQSHRRAVLAGVAGLILLSMSPVFGHHLAAGAEVFLGGKDHLWRLCLIAAHELAAPVHLLFHLLVIAGVLFAAYDRTRAWLAVRRVLTRLAAAKPEPQDPYGRAARLAGLHPGSVRVVDGLPSPAFTTGILRPRVYVARSLSKELSFEQLIAVLTHEASHVFRRDPLRLSLLRALSCTLFWLPAVRRLAADAADEAEIRADDHAACRDPLVLASAILALGRWRETVGLHAGVAFQHVDLLERRVRRLAGEVVAPRSHLNRRSILGACAVLLVGWTTGALVTHPLPADMQSASTHCEHHTGGPLDHLFCLGLSLAERPADCPHASSI
jgi:Zn-dependent protease with chaperone function